MNNPNLQLHSHDHDIYCTENLNWLIVDTITTCKLYYRPALNCNVFMCCGHFWQINWLNKCFIIQFRISFKVPQTHDILHVFLNISLTSISWMEADYSPSNVNTDQAVTVLCAGRGVSNHISRLMWLFLKPDSCIPAALNTTHATALEYRFALLPIMLWPRAPGGLSSPEEERGGVFSKPSLHTHFIMSHESSLLEPGLPAKCIWFVKY